MPVCSRFCLQLRLSCLACVGAPEVLPGNCDRQERLNGEVRITCQLCHNIVGALSWRRHPAFYSPTKSYVALTSCSPMAPLSAISGSSKDSGVHIFEDIEQQFRLDDGALHTITKQFLEDFRLGLGEYNHSMAMMCAHS
jgi:hypothetical protein